MRGLSLEVLKKDDGVALLFFVLIIFPLLVFGLIMPTETIQSSDSTQDLHKVVTVAVRSGAHMITPKSQAVADPRIDPDKAHSVFRSFLAKNLGLYEDTLAPLPYSSVAAPIEYHFFVYNGNSAYGVPVGYLYRWANGTLSVQPVQEAGFPFTVGINEEGDIVFGNGAKRVILNEPGAVGVVRAELQTIFVRDKPTAVRWASATVKKVTDN